MALTSTMYTLSIELSDVDRAVYESLEVRAAMHPSESPEYLVTRLLAYALEYVEGIAFAAGGVSDTEDPPIFVRDLTGRLLTWIEIGSPDADRLHRASKAAERVAVYTNRELRALMPRLRERRIHRGSEIPVFTFDRGFIAAIAEKLQRRMKWTLSIQDRHLYLDVDGTSFDSELHEERVE
jgi:uncharacterized protein YaeQ